MKKVILLILMVPTMLLSATRDITPQANGEGSIGRSTNMWGYGYFSNLVVDGHSVLTNYAGLTNISLYESDTNWVSTSNGWVYLGIRTNYASGSTDTEQLTNMVSSVSNQLNNLPTNDWITTSQTSGLGVAYAERANRAWFLQGYTNEGWGTAWRFYPPLNGAETANTGDVMVLRYLETSGDLQYDLIPRFVATNSLGVSYAASAGYASGLTSDVTNSLVATMGGLTFNSATNATTLNSQAAAYYLNNANITNSSYDPYKISFGASVDVSLANGAIQYYAPTSTTAIYLPASATNLEHYLSITVEPGANSFAFGTNNLYYSTNDTIGVGAGDIRIRTSGPTVLEFIKPFNSAYWRVFSL